MRNRAFLVSVLVFSVLMPAIARAAEGVNLAPPGSSDTLAVVTWPGALVGVAMLARGWKPPALALHVRMVNCDCAKKGDE